MSYFETPNLCLLHAEVTCTQCELIVNEVMYMLFCCGVCVCVCVCVCRYAAVVKDCNTALALEEDYVKAYLRRGVARRHLGRLSEAVQGSLCRGFLEL